MMAQQMAASQPLPGSDDTDDQGNGARQGHHGGLNISQTGDGHTEYLIRDTAGYQHTMEPPLSGITHVG